MEVHQVVSSAKNVLASRAKQLGTPGWLRRLVLQDAVAGTHVHEETPV
jgi:hypothetical protein